MDKRPKAREHGGVMKILHLLHRSPYWMVIAALVVSIVSLTAKSDHAIADHAFQSGDCWDQNYPLMCHEAYLMRKGQQADPSKHNYFYMNTFSYWGNPSPVRSVAQPQLNQAKTDWTSASGPQMFNCSGCAYVDYVYVYEDPPYHTNFAAQDQALHNGTIAAVTENYASVSHASPCFADACLVVHSHLVFGDPWAQNCGMNADPSEWRYLFNHEFGHMLGLADHSNGSMLMNNQWPGCHPTGSTIPTATDIGGQPPCGGPTVSDGIRCIHHWD